MREFFKSVFFKILMGVVALFLGFILFEASTGKISSPSQLISAVVSPFQTAGSFLSDKFHELIQPLTNGRQLQEDNQELQEEIAELREQLIDYQELKTENEQLREAAGIKEVNPDFEIEPARVIARDPDNASGSFRINRGSMHGVEVGDVVMTQDGLVGQVRSVGLTYAQVSTLFDPDLNVSAYEVRTNSAGVVNGDLKLAEDGCCQLLHLTKDTEVKPGDLIVTAGSSGVYPEKLVIGTVKEVKIQTNGISSYAVVETAVDIEQVTEVLVLKNFAGKGSANLPAEE